MGIAAAFGYYNEICPIKRTYYVRPPVPQEGRTRCRWEGVSPAGRLQDSIGRAKKGIPQTGETHGLGVKVHRKGENAKMQEGLALYAEMQELAESLQEAMKAEKQRQGKTNQQMIDESGVARSTVNNFFAGALGGPGLVQTAAMCKVLGMSIDGAMGLSPAPAEDVEKLREELRHKDELISTLRGGVAERKPVIYGLLGLCILLGAALMVYMVLDFQRPDVGLIRAGGVSSILLGLCLAGVCGGLWTAHRAVKDRAKRKHGEQ